jgi:hypothetical protein
MTDVLREYVEMLVAEEWFKRQPEKLQLHGASKVWSNLKKALGFGSESDKIVDAWAEEMEKYHGIDLDEDPEGRKIVDDARRLVASRYSAISQKVRGDKKRIRSYFHGNLINRYRRKLEKLHQW